MHNCTNESAELKSHQDPWAFSAPATCQQEHDADTGVAQVGLAKLLVIIRFDTNSFNLWIYKSIALCF